MLEMATLSLSGLQCHKLSEQKANNNDQRHSVPKYLISNSMEMNPLYIVYG